MKRPLRNILSMLLGEAGSRGVGFAVTVYLARILAPAAFGVLNIGMSVLGYLILAVSPGMQVVEARNVAARATHDRERAGDVLSLRLTLAVVFIALVVVVGEFWHPVTETRDVILLYVLSLFPNALLLDWYFSGKEEMLTLSLSRFLTYVVYGVVVVFLVRTADDVRLAPVAFLIGGCAAAVYLYLMYRRAVGRINLRWHPGRWKTILLENLPVGIAFFLAQSVYSLPPLVIGIFWSNADVGMFSAAMKLAFVVLLIDRIFSAMLLPVVSRFWTTKRDEVPALLRVTLRTIVVLMVPLVGFGASVAPWVMPFVFGSGYEGAVLPFRIILLFAMLTVVDSVFIALMIGSGNEKAYSRAIGQGMAVLGVCVCLFTVFWGTVGASFGLVVGELATVILMIRAAARVTELPGLREYVRPVAAAAAMVIVFIVMTPLSEIAGVIAAGIAFLAALGLMKGISLADVRYVRERFI